MNSRLEKSIPGFDDLFIQEIWVNINNKQKTMSNTENNTIKRNFSLEWQWVLSWNFWLNHFLHQNAKKNIIALWIRSRFFTKKNHPQYRTQWSIFSWMWFSDGRIPEHCAYPGWGNLPENLEFWLSIRLFESNKWKTAWNGCKWTSEDVQPSLPR